MANTDITYCNGKGCVLRIHCKRYQDGLRISANRNGDTNQYWWMDNCNDESRDGYMPTKE